MSITGTRTRQACDFMGGRRAPDTRDDVNAKVGFELVSRARERNLNDDGVLCSVINVVWVFRGCGSE
jgi:hypothetical protein